MMITFKESYLMKFKEIQERWGYLKRALKYNKNKEFQWEKLM